MTPQETVEKFIDCWNQMDMEAAFNMMSDNIVYHNMPWEPAEGKEAVQAAFGNFPPMEGADWETHFIAANGNVVLTERTDSFTLEGGKKAAIRVMGTFEINGNGKIEKWRDYFDSAEFQKEFID